MAAQKVSKRSQCVNVLLSAAGRRPYLVEWFTHAYEAVGVGGRVVLADQDALAPARASAQIFERSPAVGHNEYDEWLKDTLKRYEINIALSVNDYELSHWAQLPTDKQYEALLRLDSRTQSVVEDKILTASVLSAASISVPRTHSLSEVEASWGAHDKLVIKARWGSGSKGLNIVEAGRITEVIDQSRSEVTDRLGRQADTDQLVDDLLVAQSRIDGVEYGLDVISDFEGAHQAVLARRKLSMRNGETDKATTVDAVRFADVGEAISRAIPHRGLIDVDVIEDLAGKLWVIDINPRFGGGYPFSHVAGANVPAAYLAWATGEPVLDSWLQAAPGTSAVKYVGITAVASR